MNGQLSLAPFRATDPASSRDGARRANVGSQKARILRHLYRYDQAFGAAVSTIDADRLHHAFPEVQRSVFSTRLAAMARAGLLEADRTTNPITFRLTWAGRQEARKCS